MNKLVQVLLGTAISTCCVGGFAAPAFAGEITGQPVPKATPIKDHVAASICSFSGQDADDDSTTGVDVDDDDAFFDRTQSFGQLVKVFGSGVAQGAGAGADCKPGAHEEP